MRGFVLLLILGCLSCTTSRHEQIPRPPKRFIPQAPHAKAELRRTNLDEKLAETIAESFVYAIKRDEQVTKKILSKEILKKRLGDFLFVTLYGMDRVLRLHANAATYKDALKTMLARIKRKIPKRPPDRLLIRVEEVKGVFRKGEVRRLEGGKVVEGERLTETLFEVAQNLRLGLDSVMVVNKRTKDVSFLMSDEILTSGITDPAGWRVILETRYPADSLFVRFRTVAFLYTHPEGDVVRLFRLRKQDVVATKATVRESIMDAADYLLRVQDESGRFGYFYNAAKDRFIKGESYIRQAGTACALLEVYALTGKLAYLNSAHRTLRWLAGLCKRNKQHNFIYLKEPNGTVSLGSTSVFLWALVTHRAVTGRTEFDELADESARFLLFMQRRDGSFNTFYDEATDIPHYREVKYYEGEATLALATAARVFDNDGYLQAALRAYRALAKKCERKRKKNPAYIDAWLMKAAAKLSDHLKGPELKVVYEMADTLVEAQDALVESPYIDYRGSFSVKHGYPSGISDAALCEGLAAAYEIAIPRQVGRAEKYADALKKQAVFHLRHRIDHVNGHFLPNIERAYGAFTSSLMHMNVRIDGVQHTISALIPTLDILPE